jgi:2-amino-4-hydroxy-6-hydroxymethyldihydropteridine diphosphokinase
MSKTIGYLSLGSNLGNPVKHLREGILHLEALEGLEVVKVSSFYETAPWGREDQPPFVNLCLEILTSLTPHELLEATQGIEKRMGRIKKEVWGPRLIDIDILLMGEAEISEDDLTLPHPYMTRRAFVLIPLGEIAPGLRIRGIAVHDWIAALEDQSVTRMP